MRNLQAFIPHRARHWIVAAAVVVLLGALTGAVSTYRYVQHDADFCTSCHIMDTAYERWQSSVHAKVTCHACHLPDIASNLRQLYVYLTNPPQAPTHRPELANSVCYECHRIAPAGDARDKAQIDGNWQRVLDSAGHSEHVSRQKIQCIRCHGQSLHRFVAPSTICVECHRHQNLANSAMDQHCTTCHRYTATGRDNLLPTRKDCLECHRTMQVMAEVFPGLDPTAETDSGEAPMQWRCGKCHKPHSGELPKRASCAACHRKTTADSALHAVAAHADCLNCHKPHSWRAVPPEPCYGCHDRAAIDEHSEGEQCGECHD